jgi:hypothetical protein
MRSRLSRSSSLCTQAAAAACKCHSESERVRDPPPRAAAAPEPGSPAGTAAGRGPAGDSEYQRIGRVMARELCLRGRGEQSNSGGRESKKEWITLLPGPQAPPGQWHGRARPQIARLGSVSVKNNGASSLGQT